MMPSGSLAGGEVREPGHHAHPTVLMMPVGTGCYRTCTLPGWGRQLQMVQPQSSFPLTSLQLQTEVQAQGFLQIQRLWRCFQGICMRKHYTHVPPWPL